MSAADLLCCWGDLLYGRACCVYNAIFSPAVLCFWANRIYTCGCCGVFFWRTFYKFCCCICQSMNLYYYYTDSSFPPDDSSLGGVGGDAANAESGKSSAKVKWLRANAFHHDDGKMQLFGETVDSRDICQGALGDCWLLAAMACLAEHDGAIHAIFKSKERNPRGKYTLRLYDGAKEQWKNVTIDDYIPCDGKAYERSSDDIRPLFAAPNGNELYAMLLEKAFAKFCGSFASIEGGQTIWAIRAMTGDPARWFIQDDSKRFWERNDMVNLDNPHDRRACNFRRKGEKINNSEMFEVLLRYHQLKCVLCASGSDGSDGLHRGHAYSILKAAKVSTALINGQTFRLVQIRNPWGTGEWKGDWSDHSPLWQQHDCVRRAVGFTAADDGSFWMSWEDYVKHWSRIGVIDRTVDVTSLRLQVDDDSTCSPVRGFFYGCFRFWCCCLGARRLYCAHRSSDETVKIGGCFGFCRRRAPTSPS